MLRNRDIPPHFLQSGVKSPLNAGVCAQSKNAARLGDVRLFTEYRLKLRLVPAVGLPEGFGLGPRPVTGGHVRIGDLFLISGGVVPV